MSLRNVVGRATLAILVFGFSTAGLAQLGGQQFRGKPAAKPEQISSFKGTIEQMGRGMIQISAGAGETYIVYVRDSQKLRVTGTAELNYLRKGFMIQFSAAVDKSKGKEVKIKEEVKKLTIVTLAPPEIQAGALPDPSGGEGTYIIVGTITTLKGNAATVNVQGLSPKVKIEIAESAAIDVNVDSYGMAQKGDGIEITKGLKLAGQGGGIIQCMEGKITLTQPLKEVGKRGHAAARTAKKPDESADKGDKADKTDASADDKPSKAKAKAKAKEDKEDKDKADKDKADKDKADKDK